VTRRDRELTRESTGVARRAEVALRPALHDRDDEAFCSV
jgi:hypothetical protein